MERFKRDASRSPVDGSFSSHSRLRVAPASSSGTHSLRFGLMRETLLVYLSPILLDSVLDRAMRARNLTPASVNELELAELASDIMVGLRLFVPEDRLPQLMLDLAELLEPRT